MSSEAKFIKEKHVLTLTSSFLKALRLPPPPGEFISAARRGDLDAVRDMLERGVNINEQDKNDRETALMGAALKGHTEIVQLLIDRHADLNIQNDNGNTALHCAACVNQTAPARLLIDNGANIDIKNKRNDTALEWAESSFSKTLCAEVAQILRDAPERQKLIQKTPTKPRPGLTP